MEQHLDEQISQVCSRLLSRYMGHSGSHSFPALMVENNYVILLQCRLRGWRVIIDSFIVAEHVGWSLYRDTKYPQLVPKVFDQFSWCLDMISWYTGGISPSGFSQGSNAGQTFFIYWHTASHHNVFPFSLSNSIACFIFLGAFILNLLVFNQYLDFIFAIMWFLFFKLWGTHQTNAGSIEILSSTVYSANWTGWASLVSFMSTHVVFPLRHFIHRLTLCVVCLFHLVPEEVVTKESWLFTTASSNRCSVISSISTWRFTSSYIYMKILSAKVWQTRQTSCRPRIKPCTYAYPR